MQDKLQGPEDTPAITERRAFPRFRVTALMYIDIGKVNGGIVTSLSEGGLALMAAGTLGNGELGEGPLRLRVQFPGNPEAIEASGEIVWTSPSGKEARVRFTELEENAREQIRTWISDQASSDGLRPELPTLPKMRLPSSRRAKPRASRFSFSDVASSRVDAEPEAGTEDFQEITRNPGGLPPPQVERAAFGDGTEAVASAFESPALTDNPTGKTRSGTNKQTTQAISEEAPQPKPSPAIPERRKYSRRQILLFTYAVLGEDNGGLVFNLGERGLALTAAAPLQEDHINKIRVRFPDSADWFETSGQLVWKNDSGKEVGIEFVDLPEDARRRINEWVSQEEPAVDLRSERNEPGTSQSPAQESPSSMKPEGSTVEPFEIPAFFEEQSFENKLLEEHRFENAARTPAGPSSALFKAGIKGILERASIRRHVAKIKPPRIRDHFVKPQTGAGRKALSIAAGAALAVGGWMLFQRTSTNEANGIVAQDLPSAQLSQEAAQSQSAAKTDVGRLEPSKDPPFHSSENDVAPTGTAKPSVPQIDSGSPLSNMSKTAVSRSNNLDPALKEKPRSEQKLADAPPENLLHGPNQSQRVLAARREQETKAQQITTSVPALPSENKLAENKPVETKSAESKPAESKPVQIAQASPTFNSNAEANATPPALNANPPQPTAPPPADLAKEKAPIAPKQPEPILVRTPVVTISFDPFPSIRMPKTEKSKKSHQGKSLQMGRLLSRVDPVYPEEAKQQNIEGAVRVHAVFNRDGTVQSVIQLGGPPLLVPAAIKAVRQWRYSQTILGGQAMETEEDINVLFRLANSTSKN